MTSHRHPPSTVAYPILTQLLDSLPGQCLLHRQPSPCRRRPSHLQQPLHPLCRPSLLSCRPLCKLLPPFRSRVPVSSTTTLPLLPQDAFATSPHLQQYSAIRQLTHDLQERKPRHPKRPQLPPGEAGTPVRRIVHTAEYEKNLLQYNTTLKLCENYIDELLKQTTAELDKIITNVDSVVNKLKPPPVSKLRQFKSPVYKITPLPPTYSNSLT